MKNIILLITAILVIITSMTGMATTVNETMVHSYDGTYIQTNVSNLQVNGDGKWYILRYYPPGTLDCAKNISNDCKSTFESSLPPGYIAGTLHFSPPDYYNEKFIPTKSGIWVISLWQSGSETEGVETLILSDKLNTKLNGPIPEFPTIALSIAAMIGLVYFLKHLLGKEE